MSEQPDAHFRLRVPAKLKTSVEAQAKYYSRSINAEIIARLEDYDERLNDIRWLKTEMSRLRAERDAAERALQVGAQMKLDEALALALPKGIARRIAIAAENNGRPQMQEIFYALEQSYPPPPPLSLDWFNEEWISRILTATPDERDDLVVAANMVLEELGDIYEIWMVKDEEGNTTGSVALGRKVISNGPDN